MSKETEQKRKQDERAAALRANLRKRKAQEQGRAAPKEKT